MLCDMASGFQKGIGWEGAAWTLLAATTARRERKADEETMLDKSAKKVLR